MIKARGWVSVVELIVYIPAILLSIVVCSRHGFNRSSGWIYTLILCIVRIAGAICQLMSYHDHSTGLITAVIIIDSIGLSPLLLATLGLLSRFVDSINMYSSSMFTIKHFRVIQLLITIGLILSVAGGTSGNMQPNGTIKVDSTSKVGVILYILSFAALTLILFISSKQVSVIPSIERRVPLAVVLALPFILMRLVYSLLVVTLNDHLFNSVNGSVVLQVVMAVVEEFIVVAIYILLGFKVDKLDPAQQGPIASRAWKNKNSGRGRRGKNGRGRGVLLGIVQDAHTREPRNGGGHAMGV